MSEDRVALIQQIKAACDIVDVVGGYISLRPLGPTFKGLCPFHDDHRPSFDVDPRRQRFRCWACNKFGDVISFVQEFERIGFQEALELLARRAGISLENLQKTPHGPSRASMLDVMQWAAELFQHCLLESAQAEPARKYLGERRLSGATVRAFGLGFAPAQGDWIVQKALSAKMPLDLLETVGLVGKQTEGRGYYGRFRDRIIFPIRDPNGRTIGFGGRILPDAPNAQRTGKYYNSTETPLFSKSEVLYGLDLAKASAAKLGYLAVCEGYTDVMMAHQHGVTNVVATMGTALTARHRPKLRQVASRVVLVYDADAGGETGVDRALELFVSSDLDLRIAALPSGLDPCDLIAQQGPEAFRQALEQAVEVFEYKLRRVWARYASLGLEGQAQAVEQMLAILSAAPAAQGVKVELMINRIAQRLQLKEETLWAKLKELRGRRAASPAANPASSAPAAPAARMPQASEQASVQAAPAAPCEVRLAELLLAFPRLVESAGREVQPAELEHPGLRAVVQAMFEIHAAGRPADLDHLREQLHNERLMHKAEELCERGSFYVNPDVELADVLSHFRMRRQRVLRQQLTEKLQAGDLAAASELQQRLKQARV